MATDRPIKQVWVLYQHDLVLGNITIAHGEDDNVLMCLLEKRLNHKIEQWHWQDDLGWWKHVEPRPDGDVDSYYIEPVVVLSKDNERITEGYRHPQARG